MTTVADLDIGEVARRSGFPPSTLRYYERQGLIESRGRHGLRRRYAPEVLVRLAVIALGQRAGFSLEEIGATFGAGSEVRIDRAQLAARADAVDRTIRDLTALRDGLRHAATCPAESHIQCPTFQRLTRIALARRSRGERNARPPGRTA